MLRGFDDVTLEPVETKQVAFNLIQWDISIWDTVTQNWVVTPYEKTVYVGGSSKDFRLQGKQPISTSSARSGK